MNISKFITEIITEASLDRRIPDGMVNLKNSEHIQVIAEIMYDSGVDEEIINEFVQKFVREGKYPERQAFNKEGWLVTFPSKEYRDNAIKKHTHFISDPTHGNGGMNLYYKKKGKQARQTQQDPTVTEPQEDPNSPSRVSPTAPQTQPTQTQKTSQEPTPAAETPSAAVPIPGEAPPKTAGNEDAPEESLPTDSGASTGLPPSDSSTDTGSEKEAPAPVASPAPEPQPITPQYVAISTQFASQKGWKPTPYGEWRDAEGNSMAVSGLSGEVVPINNVHRDELKIYAEKNRT